MHRKIWITAGIIAVVTVLAVGAGAVMAQSGEDGGDFFLDRVAAKLGIAPEELEQAVRDTRDEDLDAAVERGDLTEEQAERLKERLDDAPAFPEHPRAFPRFDFEDEDGDGPSLPLFERQGKGEGWLGFGLGLLESIEELASFRGISQEQLIEELMAEDASLASVAEAHGKSREELESYISSEIDEKLAEAVESGLLTQERADDVRENLNESLDKVVDMQFGFPWKDFHFDFDFNFRDDEEVPDATTPEPQGGASEQIQQS